LACPRDNNDRSHRIAGAAMRLDLFANALLPVAGQFLPQIITGRGQSILNKWMIFSPIK
jgi:hypothetical protein